MTFVHDIDVEKFAKILEGSDIQNPHFSIEQFEKNYTSNMTWCMLFNDKRECAAAASVQVGYGPASNSTYVNEVQSLVSGNGYGKKMLMMLKKRYTFIWLCADPSVNGDALLKFYRDPDFNFSEYVIPASDSIYKKDTHIFGVNGRMPRQLWMSFLRSQYVDQHKTAKVNSESYQPPYTLDQLCDLYPADVCLKLASDPVHRWRAESGIELIHKEPTREELERIWKNWQLMSPEQKEISDKKSLEIFGVSNKTHYEQLTNNSSLWRE